MSRISYVNGSYVPHLHAAIHIEDRALQFSDGVYEVIAVRNRRLMDFSAHLSRLSRSLKEMSIRKPLGDTGLALILDEVIRQNRLIDGIVYVQISRGTSKREHRFPPAYVRPNLIVMVQRQDVERLEAQAEEGVRVITVADERWKRRDIKSVSLIGNVLAKEAAFNQGGYEAWMIDDEGLVTEGASTNAFIVDQDGQIHTRPADHDILAGITRSVLFEVAGAQGRDVVEQGFTLEQAKSAQEAFLTSTTALVLPVIQIDRSKIGSGKPGPVAQTFRMALKNRWQDQKTAKSE